MAAKPYFSADYKTPKQISIQAELIEVNAVVEMHHVLQGSRREADPWTLISGNSESAFRREINN